MQWRTCDYKFTVVQILADNIGKMVEVAFVKAEDNSRRSVYLPVEEIPEGDFYSWPISQYDVY